MTSLLLVTISNINQLISNIDQLIELWRANSSKSKLSNDYNEESISASPKWSNRKIKISIYSINWSTNFIFTRKVISSKDDIQIEGFSSSVEGCEKIEG